MRRIGVEEPLRANAAAVNMGEKLDKVHGEA